MMKWERTFHGIRDLKRDEVAIPPPERCVAAHGGEGRPSGGDAQHHPNAEAGVGVATKHGFRCGLPPPDRPSASHPESELRSSRHHKGEG
jgi:hypothetical protein